MLARDSSYFNFLFVILHTNPLLKRGLPKMKEFAPKLLPFRVDTFSEEKQNIFDRVSYLESMYVSLKENLILFFRNTRLLTENSNNEELMY